MKTSKTLAALALTVLAAVGANAETYDGVHALTSGASRTEVAAQAYAAARTANPYGENVAVAPFTSTAARSQVRAEAVAKAHDPFASLDRRAFYR
ncbi:MAG: alpha/beta hydrolase, partial [Burkholderiaceae bacterium]